MMARQRRTKRVFSARRGTAVIETVMVIPFLALIIALIFFFGYAMTNQQHLRMADRYAVWRGYRGGGTNGTSINQQFLQNKGANVSVSYSSGKLDEPTIDELVRAAGDVSRSAEGLMTLMALGNSTGNVQANAFPRDSQVAVSSQFPSNVALWNRIMSNTPGDPTDPSAGGAGGNVGSIFSQVSLEGGEWRHNATPSQCPAILQEFLLNLDSAMPSNPVGSRLKLLYNSSW